MMRNLYYVLVLFALQAGCASAQCVLGTHVDGYVVGWVRGVEAFVDSTEGCCTDVTLEVVRSNQSCGAHATLRMLGGWCDGQALQDVFPGGQRTFSCALGELAFLAFCEDQGIRWILDKGTVWAEGYQADTTGVRDFISDVSEHRLSLDDARVYRGYVMEVMRSPDPTTLYSDQRMRRDTWFLQLVKYSKKQAPKLSEVVNALGLND